MMCLFFVAFMTIGVKASAKTYSFSGTYVGTNTYSYEKTRIVLNKNKSFKVYINNKLFASKKVKKINTNTYQVPGYLIRIKLYSNKIKVYASDGRDAKIPYGGTYKKIAQYKGKALTTKQYNAIKGWWSHNSSGGYNVKFSKSGKIYYYDRYTNKQLYHHVIYKIKSTKSGYLFYLYDNTTGNKYRYKFYKNTMEYYSGWTGNQYSGSSSLFRGKW